MRQPSASNWTQRPQEENEWKACVLHEGTRFQCGEEPVCRRKPRAAGRCTVSRADCDAETRLRPDISAPAISPGGARDRRSPAPTACEAAVVEGVAALCHSTGGM